MEDSRYEFLSSDLYGIVPGSAFDIAVCNPAAVVFLWCSVFNHLGIPFLKLKPVSCAKLQPSWQMVANPSQSVCKFCATRFMSPGFIAVLTLPMDPANLNALRRKEKGGYV